MYKHILVAVDGSDASNLTIQEAMKLAKEQKAALRLIHVVDETPAYVMTDIAYALPDFQKVMREAGQKVLATCAATARQARVEVDTKFVILEVLTRRICDAINEEAKGWPADLSSSAPMGAMDLITCCLAA